MKLGTPKVDLNIASRSRSMLENDTPTPDNKSEIESDPSPILN